MDNNELSLQFSQRNLFFWRKKLFGNAREPDQRRNCFLRKPHSVNPPDKIGHGRGGLIKFQVLDKKAFFAQSKIE